MGSKDLELQDWRMSKSRRELMYTKRRHTRRCMLCGNRHPLTPQYFMQIERFNVRGLINGGLLFVCKACQAHWGPTLKDDVNQLQDEFAKLGSRPVWTVKPLADRVEGADDADAA